MEPDTSAAGNDSFTVLLITSASGRNRYHSRPPATRAVLTRMDLRFVMVMPHVSNVGVPESERRESLDACRQSADRTESPEASVVLDAERVNGPRAASLQDVQVTAVRAQRDVVHTSADECGRAVPEETNRAVRCYAEARNRSRPVARVAEAAIGGYDGRARRCRLRHEQQIARAECEAERRPTGRRVRCERTRDTVLVDRIDVEEAGALFGYYELPAVRAERH